MANDPKTDAEQGKRDTEGRPLIGKTDETKRQEREGKEDATDTKDVAKE